MTAWRATMSSLVGVMLWAGSVEAQVPILRGPITNPTNGHRYYLLAPAPWTESEARAVVLGGHLVTINDAAENAWVASTFGPISPTGRLWLGLTDAGTEGTFTWVSGEPVTFLSWRNGEPNNCCDGIPDPAGEDYAEMLTRLGGEWNDQNNTPPQNFRVNGVVEVDGVVGLVSAGVNGEQANGGSRNPALSPDGHFVAFDSTAINLAPGDTNGTADVFVLDRQARTTARVSIASDRMEGNGPSTAPAISREGRFIAFESTATNLVPGDTNGSADVFVHDRATRTTRRVSVASDGTEANGPSGAPVISAEGRFVAFQSLASNLVPGDTNGASDVFVHDGQTGATRRVSIPSGGGQAMGGDSTGAALSPEGRFVAFQSAAGNLVSGDTNGAVDVFVHDRDTGVTTRESVTSDGSQATGHSGQPRLSQNGRRIAFVSTARNLALPCSTGVPQVFVRDPESRITRCASVGPTGPANTPSRDVALSGNGRVLAFVSRGTNLAVGRAPVGGLAAPGAGLSEVDQIFTGELGGEPGEPDGPLPSLPELASESADGGLGSAGSGSPALDFDGDDLAFESEAPNLVADDTNAESDVFIVGQVLPVLDLQLNADRFRPGDTLILTARLDPGSHRRLVDAYLVLQVPDGSLFSLFGDRLVPGVVPVARFVPVPFEAIVLTYTFVGGEPAGSYSWFAALTEAGTTRVVRGLPGIDQDPFTVGP